MFTKKIKSWIVCMKKVAVRSVKMKIPVTQGPLRNEMFAKYHNLLTLSQAEWRMYAKMNCATMVNIMACRWFGSNPLSQPIMIDSQINAKEHISKIFYLKFKSFHSAKCIWRCLQ